MDARSVRVEAYLRLLFILILEMPFIVVSDNDAFLNDYCTSDSVRTAAVCIVNVPVY